MKLQGISTYDLMGLMGSEATKAEARALRDIIEARKCGTGGVC